jgi:LuxR family transcriptional regulator, maltose regulon positive regulatory protein
MNDTVADPSTHAVATGDSPGLMKPLEHCAPLCADLLDAGSVHLARSKLKPPLPGATCVHRPALLARIDAASRLKLLLLEAPVGSGKTTLLTQWHAHATHQRPVAWLSLDMGDDDPARFFPYLAEAIRCAVPGFNACLPGCHGELQQFPLQQVVSVFGEALGRLQGELVIVLDDFQWVTALSTARAFDFLVNRSPPNVHWILSARRAPKLNTVPLRLDDQLVTLDAVDLNLSGAQILQFGQGLCGRSLTAAEADCILSRTEGWVAGVKLALLSAMGPRAAEGALHQFTGSHCEVAEYFGASLLREQPEDLRAFLVASSVVDRMTGELCNALLDITHGQAMLEHLERQQLFIQPLDSQAHWYRYHTLFHGFLRGCLRRDTARLEALHERASRWFAEHQMYEEALHHAFAGGNAPWRRELLARCLPVWRQGGEVAQVIRWCEKLPRAEVMGHGEICASYVSSLLLSRRFDEAAAALNEVQAGAGQPMSPARVRMLQTMLALLSDSGGGADPEGGEPACLEGADRYLGGVLLTLQAYRKLRRHEFDAAWRLATRAGDQLEALSLHGAGYASMVASLADRARGDVKAAAQRTKQTYARVRGGRRTPAWTHAAAALAHVRYEENRLAEAEVLYTEVLPLLSVASTMEGFSTAYCTLARIKAIDRHAAEAFQLLDYLHSVLEGGQQQRFLAQLCVEKMRLCLAQDDLERARKVASEWGLPQRAAAREWHVARPYEDTWERLGFAQACLLLHQQAPLESLAILAVLRESAHAVGYVHRAISLDAALSACHWLAGETEAAFRCLNRGLALTQGLGFSRGVFDELPVLPQVIAAAFGQRKLQQPLPAEYFRKFSSMIRGSSGADGPHAQAPMRKLALPLEPLTDREVEMLRLLAHGLSNQEISAHSQIALSTTKWHLQNVFAKLDVSTRVGAVTRARALQLID